MAIVKYKISEINKLMKKEKHPEEIKEVLNKIGEECEIEGDEIRVDVNPNRPDLYSIEGIARAISNFLYLEPRKYEFSKGKYEMIVDKVEARPYIVAGIAYGVNLDEDGIKNLIQAQEKIHETFGRNRKKIAIGIHDFDKTKPPYRYTEMKYTRFIPLDSSEQLSPQEVLEKHPKGMLYGEIYKNVDKYPLVFDSEGVISFPPIINCERTRLTENTKNIFIEVTGTTREIKYALQILLCSLYDRGAKVENVKLRYPNREENSLDFERVERLEYKFLNRILGIRLKKEEIEENLKKMGFIVKNFDEKGVNVYIPPYRADIIHQIDLVEDIAIGYGYENFKPKIPKLATIGEENKESEIEDKLRIDLVGLGFYEIVSFTLSNEEKEKLAGLTNEKIRIENARSKEISIFRSSIFPSLLSVLFHNKTKSLPQKVFEIGKVGIAEEKTTKKAICALITSNKATFSEIKGVYEVINEHLGTSYKAMDFEFLIPGRSIGIYRKKEKEKIIGWCGELNPKIIRNFGLEYPIAGLEIII